MADSELQQEVQMAVRQVAEDARTSYAIRGFTKDEKPGYTFYQYRSPDEASSSTFRTGTNQTRVSQRNHIVEPISIRCGKTAQNFPMERRRYGSHTCTETIRCSVSGQTVDQDRL